MKRPMRIMPDGTFKEFTDQELREFVHGNNVEEVPMDFEDAQYFALLKAELGTKKYEYEFAKRLRKIVKLDNKSKTC